MFRSILQNRRIGYMLFELAAIIFSLFLAMWLNDWRETRNTEKLVARALSNVKNDMVQNSIELKKAIEHQKQSVKNIDRMLELVREGRDLPPGTRWKGIMLPDLLSASFDVMNSANLLSHVDYDVAKLLTICFTIQANTKKLTDTFLQGMMSNPDLMTKLNEDTLMYLKMGIQNVLLTNYVQLLERYDLVLEELNKLNIE